MASCYVDDDTIVLFSSSSSPAGSTTSPSSCSHHSPPPPPPQPPHHHHQCSNPTYELSVRNLSYTIHPNRPISSLFCHPQKKQQPKPINILKSVSFVARSSEILAVVGPSGTGKSSLLRIISGRVREKDFDPKSVSLNNHTITSPTQMRKTCGFVAQDDNLLPLLTVYETLMFSAKFRLKSMTPKQREDRVEALMHEIGLFHVADSFVGDHDKRGISGGERKRVSIGVEMINDPPILLLDEPTSGLDSSSALQVIELLSSMAKLKRRTIVLSIHQPSFRILECISKFLILSGGSVVHDGCLESLEDAINDLGFKIPVQLNPLEFSMEIISVLEDSKSDKPTHLSNRVDKKQKLNVLEFSMKIISALEEDSNSEESRLDRTFSRGVGLTHLSDRKELEVNALELKNSNSNSNSRRLDRTFSRGIGSTHLSHMKDIEPNLNALELECSMELKDSNSGRDRIFSREVERTHLSDRKNNENPNSSCFIWQEETSNKHRTTCFQILFEIWVLCERFWKIIYRTKQLFLARTMQAIVGGFGLGSVYIRLKNDENGVAQRLGLFAFSLSFLLSSTVEALPIYLQERCVLMKEASRGAYRVSSYMIANTIVFLPFLFAVALLFAVPVYWLVGLNPSVSAFAFFAFVVWLIVLMASSLVLFLSAVSPDFISGNSLICTVLGAFFLFSGYFIPKESIPGYWIFMYYVSLYRYPLDSLLINEYWSMREYCFSSNPQDQSQCLLTGSDVLKNRGLEKDTRWLNVGIMFGFFLFYRLLCWIILVRRVSKTTI
ncbi:unnamed protein product [Camellia sinensis]